MNLHVIPQTLEELKSANPAFLDELSKHGKILFARFPLEVSSRPLELEPFSLITYDMADLSYRDKMKTIYFLYRKGGKGAVAQTGGKKLSDGCVLVPTRASIEIMDTLNDLGVNARKLEVHVNKDQLKDAAFQQQTAR